MNRTVIIGLGGIGGVLVNYVWKYLDNPTEELILLDGDTHEINNLTRQYFMKLGAKVDNVHQLIAMHRPMIKITPKHEYYPGETKIQDGDTVLICVDDHHVRRMINEDCKKLNNITVINGGNELTDGNVQFYVKQNGKLVMGDYLDTYHPEIALAEPTPKVEPGCDRAPEPQFLVTNAMVATTMFIVLFMLKERKLLPYSEVYIDIEQNKIVPINRKGGENNGREAEEEQREEASR